MKKLIFLILALAGGPLQASGIIFVGYDDRYGIEKLDSITGESLGFLNLGTTSEGYNLNDHKYHNLEFGPDGNLYIGAGSSIGMYAINPATGSVVREYATYRATGITFDNGLGYVTSASGPYPYSKIFVFDPLTGATINTVSTHYPQAIAIAGTVIFVGYDDRKGIEKVDSITGESLGFLNLGTTSEGYNLNDLNYANLEFGPDGNLYIGADGGIGMYAINPATGSIVREYATYRATGITFDNGLGYVTSASGPYPYSKIFVFDPLTGDTINTLSTHDPQAIALLPNVVPIPAAVWLFGSGLGLLGWLRRRRTA